ncbi:MAG: PAS domain S-box protein [Desulfobacteraceae bacterium]|nr:PAS domain S-box protein [Desulfobacteraceae bacterium]
MQLHPITLAFRGSHKGLEALFRSHYFEQSLRQLRLTLAVVVVFYAGHGLLDAIFVPEHKFLFWTLRWGVGTPAILGMLIYSYSKSAVRWMQPATALGTTLAGIVLIVMVFKAPGLRQSVYLGGLVQVCFASYTLLRLRFIWAAATVVFLVIALGIGSVFLIDLPREAWSSYLGFMSGTNFLGMLACYSIEHYIRKNFFLSRQIESQKRRLDMSNKLLEKRVEKRTAEMTLANQKLEAEIKERKQTEMALQESKIRYGRMINNVTDYLCVHDMKGLVMEVNFPMIAGLGYSQAELIGHNLKDFMTDEHRDSFYLYLANLAKGRKATGNVTFITKSGLSVLMEYSSVMVQNSLSGDVVYCLARDITERRRTELALAESRARFKDIFDTAAAGMMIVEQATRKVVEINPAAAQMIGESVAAIQGRILEQLIAAALPEPGQPETSIHTQIDPVECDLITKSENTTPILKTIRPMEFNGQPHWLISFISIERIKEAEAAKREAESQLNRAQHLQAIGTLAGGIAHDFNNILYGVIGYTQLALDDAPKGSQLEDNLTEILQGSKRAKELVSQILTFSRQDDTEKKPIRPAPLVKEALKLLRASIPATIEIQSRISPRTETILANPTQLHQIVMNLCTNAAHAMQPQGGLLRVEMENVTLETEEPALHGSVKPGIYVRLRVKDNGTGMPASILNRIFEPFFTTKSQGEGTGMGLAVVLGVAQSHDGAIRVHSEPGKGSQFEILLPVAARSAEESEESEQPLPKGTERILFVDDEKPIIQMGHQMLTKLGYHVTTCQNPMEALELFRSKANDFDLVITDLTMPKLKGTKLAQHLIHIKPELPIILCTGYGDEITDEQIKEVGIRELMLKPILRQHLAVTIRQALDAN